MARLVRQLHAEINGQILSFPSLCVLTATNIVHFMMFPLWTMMSARILLTYISVYHTKSFLKTTYPA